MSNATDKKCRLTDSQGTLEKGGRAYPGKPNSSEVSGADWQFSIYRRLSGVFNNLQFTLPRLQGPAKTIRRLCNDENDENDEHDENEENENPHELSVHGGFEAGASDET